jgi:hypothetical protein
MVGMLMVGMRGYWLLVMWRPTAVTADGCDSSTTGTSRLAFCGDRLVMLVTERVMVASTGVLAVSP